MKELLFLYSNCKEIVYRVAEGETLFEICKKFNQTPARVIADNQLKSPPKPNSLLYIERGEGLIYQVKVGETLNSIASRHFKSGQEILQNNGVTYIYPYQIIKV